VFLKRILPFGDRIGAPVCAFVLSHFTSASLSLSLSLSASLSLSLSLFAPLSLSGAKRERGEEREREAERERERETHTARVAEVLCNVDDFGARARLGYVRDFPALGFRV